MKSVQQLILAIILIFLAACSDKIKVIVPERQAPPDIKKSFENSNNSATQVVLKKNSLGKAFLLITSAKTAAVTPQWMDGRPMVVSFERSGNRLALMELGVQNIYDDIPSDKLLQSFAIVKEDKDSVTFDWTAGFNSLIQRQQFDISLFNPKAAELKSQGFDLSLDVKDSLVKDVQFNDNQMTITQVSRVQFQSLKEEAQIGETKKNLNLYNLETTYTVSINIRPYSLNSEFTKSVKEATNSVGFFTLSNTVKGKMGQVETLNMKWDTSDAKGPITYAISSDVPEDISQAVEEGVKYWNRVLGKDAFRVQLGVSNHEFPKDRTVMVRWINWQDAGFAYASMQADPLTGELLRGQIFFTSSIKTAFDSKATGNLMVLKGTTAQQLLKMNPSIVCVYENWNGIKELLPQDDPAYKAKRAEDIVRLVVAHEVGHTVGLRHNFAGSFSEKNSIEDIQKKIVEYASDIKNAGFETSTTVMDYLGGMDLLLLGAYIKNNVLPYDQIALDYLYGKRNSGDKSVSDYCSDEHIMVAQATGSAIYGCNRFDAFNSPLKAQVYATVQANNKMLSSQWETLLALIFSQKSEVSDSELDATLGYFYASVYNNAELGAFAQMLSDRTIDNKQKPYYIGIDLAKSLTEFYGLYLAAGYAPPTSFDSDLGFRLKNELTEIGGLSGVFKQVLTSNFGNDITDPNAEAKDVESFFAQSKMEGQLPDGRSYKLSQTQYQKVQNKMKEVALQISKSKLNTLSSMMLIFNKSEVEDSASKDKVPQVTTLRADIGQEAWYPQLTDYVTKVILTVKEIKKENVGGVEMEFPFLKWEAKDIVGLFKVYDSALMRASSSVVALDVILKQQIINILSQSLNMPIDKDVSVDKLRLLEGQAEQKGLGPIASDWVKERINLLEGYNTIIKL